MNVNFERPCSMTSCFNVYIFYMIQSRRYAYFESQRILVSKNPFQNLGYLSTYAPPNEKGLDSKGASDCIYAVGSDDRRVVYTFMLCVLKLPKNIFR